MGEQMDEQKVIDDVGALKALADTRRLTMLLAMTDRPRTVKEIAASMDVPVTRLYYHVRLLEQHGLLRVASTRMVSGIEERRYQATAKSWTIAAPLLSSALARTGVLKALFDLVASELAMVLEGADEPLGDPESDVQALVYTQFVLDRDQVADVRKRLEDLMLEYGAEPQADDDRSYGALFALYRKP
jgi:DNA-binding transcriptional ArsR family regulator